jgi:hypothetical protein
MQLKRHTTTKANTDINRTASAPAPETPQSTVMREYEARRRHICRCRYPSFGFGAPLTQPGHTIWACFAHRSEVEGPLNPPASLPTEPEPRLL